MSRIKWTQGPPTFTRPLTLRADFNASESDIDPIQAWCQETGIGKRTSFDTFAFSSKADMSMFLLRWDATDTNNSY